MKIVVTPSEEVVGRALALGWERDLSKKFYFEQGRRAGLVVEAEPFSPIIYLGTVSFVKHKIRRNLSYALTDLGPVFSGDLIKDALKILGKKRVRVYLHYREEEKDKWFTVLLLGTKEGTVAMAPRVPSDQDRSPIDETTLHMKDFWRGVTSRMKRGLIFEQI